MREFVMLVGFVQVALGGGTAFVLLGTMLDAARRAEPSRDFGIAFLAALAFACFGGVLVRWAATWRRAS